MDLNSILVAAKTRLKDLRKELGKLDILKEEEQKLVRLLQGHKVSAAAPSLGRKGKGRRGGGAARAKGPSKLNLAVNVLKKSKGGLMVKEILAQLRKSHPGLFKVKDASALLSRALNQSLKAKTPRVKVVAKGGPGRPTKYAAASSASPGPKAKGKGSSPRRTGAPSKLVLATEVLKKSKEGLTVNEIHERLRKSQPDLFKAKYSNRVLARILRQEAKSKTAKVKVLTKGGRGKPVTYGAAA